MTSTQGNHTTIRRLTALWALGECGLGGWMHALKLPFTGIFVGGFAVVIISLLAHYSRNNYKLMMQALLTVLFVKFTVSPQSPPQAYLAVAFQGAAGAMLYKFIPSFRVAALLFAAIAMLESAVQKVLVMTLIFGSPLWEALNKMYAGIADDFSIAGQTFSFWLIAAYVSVYMVWGIILGIWIGRLPHRISRKTVAIRYAFEALPRPAPPATQPDKRHNRQGKILGYIGLAIFIAFAFIWQGEESRALYVIIRTLAIVLLFYLLINPLLKWLMERQLRKQSGKRSKALQEIISLLPEMRASLSPAYKLAASGNKGWRKYPAFVLILIIITLNPVYNGPE